MIAVLGLLLHQRLNGAARPAFGEPPPTDEVAPGSGCTTADIALAIQSSGGWARVLGHIGDDEAGHRLVMQLQLQGVESFAQNQENAHTVSRSPRTQPALRGSRGTADDSTACPKWLRGVDVLHVQGRDLLAHPMQATALMLINSAREGGISVTVNAPSSADIRAYGPDAVLEILRRVTPDVFITDEKVASLLGLMGGKAAGLLPLVIVARSKIETLVMTGECSDILRQPGNDNRPYTDQEWNAFIGGFLAEWSFDRQAHTAVEGGYRAVDPTIEGVGSPLDCFRSLTDSRLPIGET